MKSLKVLLLGACVALCACSSPTSTVQTNDKGTQWQWENGTIVVETPQRPADRKSVIGLALPKMEVVRVGFVGLGMRGPGAVERFTHIPGTQIVALCDYEQGRAEACQKYLKQASLPKAAVYSGEKGYEELCKRDDIDLVYIATDWLHHFPVAMCAMENGKNVAIEVPSAMNLKECWALVDMSEKTRKHCMILENCCYDWFEMNTLNMAQQGVFGEVIRAQGAYIHNLSPFWNHYWKNGEGDKVQVYTAENEQDEASHIADVIGQHLKEGGHLADHAILYRMNAQSNALEYALKRNAIPYKVVGGMKFFDRAEIKDMLAYLCVLNNPMDDLRLRRIINTPARGIGATTMDKVAELAAEQGASLYEVIRNADLFPTLKAASAKLIKFADLIDGLRRAGATLALPEFYDEVLNQTGYVRALEEKKDMESRGRIENVQELKSNILGFLEQDPEDATLSGFLNEIALYTDLDSVEADDNCVTMMTIHSAKGLEFPVVYVVGMEEGIFPGTASMYDEEELEGGDVRTVLHFHPALAPVKIGVLPLSKKLNEGATKVFEQLSKKWNCEYDDRGNIGKRYRRQDEIGTPFCVTYDFDSEEDGAVTVRDRDTMEQERIKIEDLAAYFEEKLAY